MRGYLHIVLHLHLVGLRERMLFLQDINVIIAEDI